MNKNEFLEKLKKKIDLLSDTEIKDIIDEYSDTIDQKVQEGKSEEEAVKDFGDIDQLVRDIFDAYKIKIKNNTNKTKDAADKAGDVLNEIIDGLSKFLSSIFKDLTVEGISRTLVLVGIGLLVLILLRIPFGITEGLFSGFIHILFPYSIALILSRVLEVFISILFLLVSIIIIISFIRVGVNGEEINAENLFRRPLNESIDSLKGKKKRSEPEIVREEEKTEEQDKQEEQKIYHKEAIRAETKTSDHYFGRSIVKIFVWILRFLGFLFILPLLVLMIFTGIGVGLIVYLLTQGISLYGVVFLLVGAMGVLGVILNMADILIFSKKVHSSSIVFGLLVSTVLIGIGLPLTIHEVSRFDTVYYGTEEAAELFNDSLDIVGRIKYEKDTIYDLSNYRNITIISDTNLDDEIIIESYNADLFEITTYQTHREENTVIHIYEDDEFTLIKEGIKATFDALQHGKSILYRSEMMELVIRIPERFKDDFKYIDHTSNQRMLNS